MQAVALTQESHAEDGYGMSDARLEWHFDNWASWMSGRALRLGYPSRASGRMGSSGSTDFDAMVANADTRCAYAVDAILDGLPIALRLAVYHVKLAAVFRLRLDVQDCYTLATIAVRKGLTERGIF